MRRVAHRVSLWQWHRKVVGGPLATDAEIGGGAGSLVNVRSARMTVVVADVTMMAVLGVPHRCRGVAGPGWSQRRTCPQRQCWAVAAARAAAPDRHSLEGLAWKGQL
jgi:hypothetical protein